MNLILHIFGVCRHATTPAQIIQIQKSTSDGNVRVLESHWSMGQW